MSRSNATTCKCGREKPRDRATCSACAWFLTPPATPKKAVRP